MSTEITLPQATVGIVTALPKEHAAVCAVFQTKVRAAGVSGTVYDLCTVPCVGGQIIVAITQFLGMGNNLAAAQTSRMLSDCESIRHVIMVGIAGAIPCPEDANKHVRLGDIVVSSSHGVFQFDFGKHVQGKPFEYLSVPTKPSARLISAINRLMSLEEMGQQPWLSHIAQACRQFPEWHRPNPDTDILDDGTGTIPHPVDTNRKQEGVLDCSSAQSLAVMRCLRMLKSAMQLWRLLLVPVVFSVVLRWKVRASKTPRGFTTELAI